MLIIHYAFIKTGSISTNLNSNTFYSISHCNPPYVKYFCSCQTTIILYKKDDFLIVSQRLSYTELPV
nr:MAG TPA: hypothetical protein [Caudoviricetes sp.]